jgi:hypothetical protein
MDDLVLSQSEITDSFFSFRSEIIGPLIPERDLEEVQSLEYNFRLNNYSSDDNLETSVILKFIDDFPIGMKSGGLIFKWKLKI